VLSGGSVDVLCHAAVRARDAGVMLAACRSAAGLEEFRHLEGRLVTVEAAKGSVAVTAAGAAAGNLPEASSGRAARPRLHLRRREWCGSWALPGAEFSAAAVGAKSLNTIALQGRLPGWVGLPPAAAVPFGACEAAVADAANAGVAERLRQLEAALPLEAAAPERLAAARDAVLSLRPPAGCMAALEEACSAAGMQLPGGEAAAWCGITKVWASQYSSRAHKALAAAGADAAQLQMAVLVQPVVAARYAWVAHTRHPVTGDDDTTLLEVVRGMGEALVGNHPGAALAATARKSLLPATAEAPPAAAQLPAGCIRVVRYPSKSAALMVSGGADDVIFRSDSNAEDLEGFAGAGLFDSVTARPLESQRLDTTADPLLTNITFQQETLGRIAAAAAAVEAACCGIAQDVEGVVAADGRVWVVQTRPQV
jgi:alpha-glucan,water dikinase